MRRRRPKPPDLSRLQHAFESGHRSMSPLHQRLLDRRTIGAVEKEIFLREIARSECIDAASIGAVAIDAVAFRVVVEQHFATGRFGAIRTLPADLEHVFDYVIDFCWRQIFLVAEILGVFLGTILRVIGQHIDFRPMRIFMPGADAIAHRPFDIGGKLGVPSGFIVVPREAPFGVGQIWRVLIGNALEIGTVTRGAALLVDLPSKHHRGFAEPQRFENVVGRDGRELFRSSRILAVVVFQRCGLGCRGFTAALPRETLIGEQAVDMM